MKAFAPSGESIACPVADNAEAICLAFSDSPTDLSSASLYRMTSVLNSLPNQYDPDSGQWFTDPDGSECPD